MAAAGRCVGRRLRLAVLQAAGDRRREYSVEPHSRRQSVVATRVWREVLEKGLLDGVSSEADAYHGAAVGEAQGPGALPISSQVKPACC